MTSPRVEATEHTPALTAALRIYAEVLHEVRADRLVIRSLQRAGDHLFVQGHDVDLSSFRRRFVVALGKAAPEMASAALAILGSVDGGCVVAREVDREWELPTYVGGHPVPNEGSLAAGRALLELASTCREGDFVLFLLSGGASALAEVPVDGVSLKDLQTANESLLRSGRPIQQMNQVRARLSLLKGGGLAKAFGRAAVVCLVLSDVVGSDLSAVGSGPLLAGSGGPAPRLPDLPASVVEALERAQGPAPVPPVPHFVVGSVSLAIHEALEAAERVGLQAFGYADPLNGEASDMARRVVRLGRLRRQAHGREPFCLVLGGETTVSHGGGGLGGRCQEMAVAAADGLRSLEGCGLLVAGTDGFDGPTDAAGGTVDPGTVRRAQAHGWTVREALGRHESHRFLEASDNLIRTGPTGSNVNDLALFVSVP